MSTATEGKLSEATYNYLIRGSDYLASRPGFKLEGRKEELKDFANNLMRGDSSNILLVGPGGVGCSSLTLGLQASKDDPETPFDIVNKRLFWLDTDGLFGSGDMNRINQSFEKILGTLTRLPGSVLIIDDTRDFLEGARNSGCMHLVNALLREARTEKIQLVMEVDENDLDMALKAHSDMREIFTLFDLKEPKPEALGEIIKTQKERLEKIHGISISQEAIDTAIDLTTRYRVHTDLNLSRAQPGRAIALLDRALTSYRQKAHSRPPQLEEMEARLGMLNSALEKNIVAPVLAGKSKDELQTLKTTTQDEISSFKKSWEAQQKELRKIYKEQRDGEEAIRKIDDQIEAQRAFERKKLEDAQKSLDPKETPASHTARQQQLAQFVEKTQFAGFDSEEVQKLTAGRQIRQEIIDKNKSRYVEITTAINKTLQLSNNHVLDTFSKISGIAANKLTQDEREKLLSLEPELSRRVFSQDEAIQKVADTTRVANSELRDEDKPRGAFIFLGPSGTGKTELSTVFNEVMYGDKDSLLTIAMGEYKEKHAIAKLIGAPPGYEGFKAGGGILPQAMRANPRRGVIFDEAEKAEVEVFDVLMQIIDKGELIDNVGRPYSFKDATIFLTSNIGAEYFLDPDLTFEQAKALALDALGKKFRPEFLNRFQGRENIICFQRLDTPTIERIARRELSKLNARIEKRGLKLSLSDESVAQMCKDNYNPNYGARGITGYFATAVKSNVAKTLISMPDAKGVMEGRYLSDRKTIVIDPPAAAIAAPASATSANQNTATMAAPAKQDLKLG